MGLQVCSSRCRYGRESLATLNSVARARFAREVEILKRFDHPHIEKPCKTAKNSVLL